MSVTKIQNSWIPNASSGNDGTDRTKEVNIARQAAMVQVSIYEASGDGLIYAGIRAYRHLPDPAGAEIPVDFGPDWHNWPPSFFITDLTSVTLGIALGAHQECSAMITIFSWEWGSTMKHSTSTGTVGYESSKACVVYDVQTGSIFHIHQVVTLRGGKSPADQEIEAAALDFATNDSRQRSCMRVLHVNPDNLMPRMSYKVDLAKLTLISETCKADSH
jgi:hypothetical protein